MKSDTKTTASGEKKITAPAGKAPAKGVKAGDKKKKKAHHVARGQFNFRSAVKRMFKNTYQASPPQVSGPVIESLCNMICDVTRTISQDCEILARKVGKQTINLEEVMSATLVNLTGELRTHAMKEIKEAVAKVPARSSK